MSLPSLSTGALSEVYNSGYSKNPPIFLRVIDIRRSEIAGQYDVQLYDGSHSAWCELSKGDSEKVESGIITRHSVLLLEGMMKTIADGKTRLLCFNARSTGVAREPVSFCIPLDAGLSSSQGNNQRFENDYSNESAFRTCPQDNQSLHSYDTQRGSVYQSPTTYPTPATNIRTLDFHRNLQPTLQGTPYGQGSQEPFTPVRHPAQQQNPQSLNPFSSLEANLVSVSRRLNAMGPSSNSGPVSPAAQSPMPFPANLYGQSSQGLASAPATAFAREKNLQQGTIFPQDPQTVASPSSRGGRNVSAFPVNLCGQSSQEQVVPLQQSSQGYGSQPARSPSSATARMNTQAPLMRINDLNPYSSRSWAVKGRVTSRSDKRRLSKPRDLTVFDFYMADADGGEIKVSAWDRDAEKFDPVVKVGQVFILSHAKVSLRKENDKMWNHTKHKCEIVLERESVLLPVPEEDASAAAVPKEVYNFIPLSEVAQAQLGSLVDVVGVLVNLDDTVSVQCKNGSMADKRSLVLRDNSGASMEVTLWGNLTSEPGDQLEVVLDTGRHPVLAVKSAKVGEFRGAITLSTISSSRIAIDPEVPQTQQLHEWYEQQGSLQPLTPVQAPRPLHSEASSRRCFISSIDTEELGRRGHVDRVTIYAAVTSIRQQRDITYPGCKNCFKKLIDRDTGGWFCERCHEARPEPLWCYILSATIADHTGYLWVKAFGAPGEVLLGLKAEEFRTLDAEEQDRVIAAALLRPMLINLTVTEETFQGATSVKATISGLVSPHFTHEGTSLLRQIQQLDGGLRGRYTSFSQPSSQQAMDSCTPVGHRFPGVTGAMPYGASGSSGSYTIEPEGQPAWHGGRVAESSMMAGSWAGINYPPSQVLEPRHVGQNGQGADVRRSLFPGLGGSSQEGQFGSFHPSTPHWD